MHELSVTNSIVETVLRYAEEHGAKRILTIRLGVGELSDMNEEWIQRYFDRLSNGTLAEEASIRIERIAPGFQCHECKTDFDMKLVDSVRCPSCGGTNCTLERGREFFIEEMEIET